MNTSGFCTFVDSIFSNSIPESEIFNGYTTFMMCGKRSDSKGIWHHRMNWLVNNYIRYGDGSDGSYTNRYDYCQYYIKNIVDNYSGKYLPPSCKYNRDDKNSLLDYHEQDDIFTHYINISKKFEYINDKYLSKYSEISEEDEVEYLQLNYDDMDLEVFEKKKSPTTRLVNFLKKKDDVCKNSNSSNILCDYDYYYNSDYSENEIFYSILEEDSEEYDD